ncbi:MAG: rhomboid family intramembrane serine protease [Verrucomicrobiota bacterium]
MLGFFKKETPGRLTRIIIAINVVIAIAGLALDAFLGTRGVAQSILGLHFSDLAQGKIWQLFTYMWVHAELVGPTALHLVFNMMTLYMFGRVVESELGPKHFISIYFLGALVSVFVFSAEVLLRDGMAIFQPSPNGEGGLVGASGGVCAIVMAFALLRPNTKLMIFPIPVPVRAIRMMMVFAGLSLLLVVTAQVLRLSDQDSMESSGTFWSLLLFQIAHSAHLGGLGWGYFYMVLLHKQMKKKYSQAEPNEDKGYLKNLSARELLQESNRVIDKMNRYGVESLSQEEYEILDLLRRRM